MSNPTDPKQPNPDQPDPKAPDGSRSGGSSFEFVLPDEVGSFGELPAVPDPAAGDSGTLSALPPRPAGGFDFGGGSGSRGSFGDLNLDAPAVPPLEPIDDAIVLPDFPAVPGAGDSAILFESPLPPVDPASAVLHIEPLEPTTGMDDVPPLGDDALAEIDLATASGVDLSEAPKVSAGDSSVGFGSPLPLPAVPGADSSITLDVVEATAAPSSVTLGGADVPVARPAASLTPASVPDVGALFPAAPVLAGSSGSTPELPNPAPGAAQVGASSFEFVLPDGVNSISELPPIPDPDADDSNPNVALPPKPVAQPVGAASFDFINVSGSRSFADIGVDGQTIDAVPVAEAVPAPSSKVGLGDPVPVDPVAPVSGWLDSAVLANPAQPVPTADAFDDTPIAELAGGSDIFSGTVPTAELAESSSVLEVSGGSPPVPGKPADPVRPSDIALTFNAPPGGSTLDSGISDLPDALELVDDSGTALLGSPGRDDESIHDAPLDAPANPLFDSANLSKTPNLPGDRDSSADYGVMPGYTSDASSILGDLGGPLASHDGDSSSVRVEAPGFDRTLTGGASDGVFDLTAADEPVPAELFDEPADPTDDIPVEVDLDAVDLADEVAAPPSDIITGTAPAGASARIGGPRPTSDEPTGDLTDDAVEFTDYPELGRTVASGPLPPAEVPGKRTGLSSADFELPAANVPDDGAVDWDDAVLAGGDEATRGMPRDASLSGILRGELPDDSSEVSTKSTRPLTPAADDDEPVVTVDWMAGSAESEVAPVPTYATEPPAKKGKPRREDRAVEPTEAKTKPTKSAKPARLADTGTGTATTERATKPERKGGRGGLLAGLLVGGLVTGGALAGVYLGGVVPNGDKVAVNKPAPDGQQPPQQQGNATTPPVTGNPPAVLNPDAAFATGDTAKALDHYKATPPATTAEKASAGSIRVFAKVQALKDGAPVAADDADLKAAREDLRAVVNDEKGRAEPGGAKRAVKAAVALGVSHEIAGDTKAAREVYIEAMGKFPEYASTFEALIDKLNALEAAPAPDTARRLDPADAERVLFAATLLLQDAPKGEDPEPGVFYWKAVNLAGASKFKEAIEQIEKAKAAHLARAKAVAGRGLNPLSDPLEQIFTRSCDDLKAYWTLRAAVYGNPAVAAAIKRDGGVGPALEALLKAEQGLVTSRETVKKLAGDVAKAGKEMKAAEKEKLDAEEKLKTTAADLKAAEKKLDTATTELAAAEKRATDQTAVLDSVVEALKPAAPLPEKYTAAELVAATKAVASRATGPDLKNLVPSAMQAIGGGGLATGQLLDIADRLAKAEAAAKDATAKLAAETKKLNEKYDTDTKKLKEENDAAVKELKVASAADLKKLADKYAIDSKKLTDDYAVATDKLKTAHEAALKDEQARTEAEKKRLATREIEFQKQLANAVTPGQVMDIWLPVLTDLRRASDAPAAQAAADKALAGSAPDSEDAAKARTVRGMALLLKGEYPAAKDAFQAARRSPAYKDAQALSKPWALAADNGLEAIDDPVAPYRRPVILPPVDVKAAAQSLDAGITAYKVGRHDAAISALLNATKNNPADPVGWYFLGAARWAKGDEEQAKKDFAQGAEREKETTTPARATSAALTPIQGATRDVIDRTRP